MIRKLKITKDNLFCIGYTFFLVGQILGHTFISVPQLLRYVLIIIGLLFILLKIIAFDHIVINSNNVITILFLVAYFIVSIISSKKSGSLIPITTFLLIIGARNVTFDNILKVFIWTASILLVITFLLYFLGLINESTASRDGSVRHSFGYRHPTDLVAMIASILMGDMYLCIKNKRIVYPRIILYLIFGIFALTECDARLGSVTIFALIPIIMFLYRKRTFNSKLTKFFIKNSFYLCLILSIVITQEFTTHLNRFLFELNQLVSYRLTYQAMAVKFFGYSIWGQEIYQRYTQMFDNNSWFFIDSSYYIFLIQYGIILMILWSIFYYLCQKRQLNQGEYIIPFLLLIMCIDGLIEQHLYSSEYNVFLLSFIANVSINSTKINF